MRHSLDRPVFVASDRARIWPGAVVAIEGPGAESFAVDLARVLEAAFPISIELRHRAGWSSSEQSGRATCHPDALQELLSHLEAKIEKMGPFWTVGFGRVFVGSVESALRVQLGQSPSSAKHSSKLSAQGVLSLRRADATFPQVLGAALRRLEARPI